MDRNIDTIRSSYSRQRFLQVGETTDSGTNYLHLMVTDTPYPECQGGIMLNAEDEARLFDLLLTRQVTQRGGAVIEAAESELEPVVDEFVGIEA